MKLLVTGGAGFVGSNFIRHMMNTHEACQVIILDKITYAGNMENLQDVASMPNYHFIHGDICDRDLVNRIMKEYHIDIIVNFAAESHVDRSIVDPSVFVMSNIVGTQSLLEAAVQNKIKKVIQISTDEVYGSLGDSGYFTELSPIAPNNPYSASKAAADLLVRSYHHTYGLSMNIVRFANTYGPSQYPEKLIPMTITHALANKTIAIHGLGLSIRDWFYVKDNVSAIDTILHRGRSGEIYNIGARQEKRTIDVVHFILDILDKPRSLIELVEDRAGQDYRYANDPSKVMQNLEWKPSYSFELGLQQTIEWYQSNRKWWQSLQIEAWV